MLNKGLFYFYYSLNNLDDFPDPYYMNDVIIIDSTKDIEFLNKVQQLRDLITAYCTLKENRIKEGIEEILYKIESILLTVENINYTEFVAYWKSLDTQFGTFLEIPDKKKLLKILLDKYCERRKILYEKYGYTNVSVQAIYDSGSSRSKGQKFKPKIKNMVNKILGIDVIFIEKRNWEKIKDNLNLNYNFGNIHQNKIPDFYIEYKGHHIIGEAKHIHNKGGAQDKQIGELIDFINQSENTPKVHYLSFLDGLYLYYFSQSTLSDKLKKQKEDIENALNKNSQNFFVNTKGFEKLLKDLKDE